MGEGWTENSSDNNNCGQRRPFNHCLNYDGQIAFMAFQWNTSTVNALPTVDPSDQSTYPGYILAYKYNSSTNNWDPYLLAHTITWEI